MRRIIFYLWQVQLYLFFKLCHKQHDFRGGRGEVIEHEVVFGFFLQFLCDKSVILRIIQQDIITNMSSSSYKVLPYSCQILIKFEFSR